ncbi:MULTISPECIES: hypothetical protein [Thalassospira]|nr:MULTISPECIES: hypothetical protein [Thalassospira]
MLAVIRARAAAVSRSLGFHKITDGFRRLGTSFVGLSRHISGVGAGLLGLAGIGLGGGLLAWIHGGADDADVLAKFGRRVGLTTEQLQQWQHAANQAAGMTNADLMKSFRDLSKNVGDAANGIGRAKPIFDAMGISLRDGSGEVRGFNELLPELQAAFSKIEDPSLKTSAAMKLFGESGIAMAQLLSQPQAELERLFDEMTDLGMISGQAAKDTEAYNDAMDSFGKSVTGVRNGLMGALFPVLTPLVAKMKEFVISMRPQIVESLSAAIIGVSATMSQWFTVAKDGTTPAGQAIMSFISSIESMIGYGASIVDFLGGWQNAALGFAALMAGPFIASLLSVGTAFANLGWVLASNPIVLAAGLIAGAVYAIYDNWDGIVSFFTGKIEAVRGAFKNGFIDGIMAYMAEFNPFSLLYDGFTGLVEYITGFDLASIIEGKIRSMVSVLPDWVVDRLGISQGDAAVADTGAGEESGPVSDPSIAQTAQRVANARVETRNVVTVPEAPEGKITIELVGGGAQEARVVRSASRGIGLETNLKTGPSLAGLGAG